ncbi:HNH endonuclease [Pseudomonas indica]|uniref:HNH endonuclease n=1 Tax=Pseudomonas indica TaxID=137658 RepID=UPI0009FE915F|nr:HNH endonuclease signature motif containing protein [Pseudomonas indica]
MTEPKDLESRAALIARNAYDEFWINLIECSQILQNLAPAKRRPWIIDVVRDLHRKQGGLCALCNQPLELSEMDVDHKIPFCYGGGNESSNIQLAHSSCNRSKRAEVDPHDLLRYLEDRYMNLSQSN